MRKKDNHAGLWAAAVGIGGLLMARAAIRWAGRFELKGSVVLITGGSRGLGLVLAREMVKEGARVAICARDEQEMERARQDLQQRGGDVLAVQCDVTAQEQVQGMIDGLLRHFGRIDVLINNAGVIDVGPMELMTLEDYTEAMKTHFWGPLYATLAALPHMRQRKQGRIINISSIGGKVSVPHLLPYNVSKFALTGFSEGLRAELAADGIRVSTICPGLMRTGSPRHARFKGQHRLEYTWFSLGDALPVASMDARRAARKIIQACKYGDAEVILSMPAKLAAAFHGLFPGLTADLLGLVNRLLPGPRGPGGIGSRRAKGYESHSAVSPSFLTALNERAARFNNEM